METDPRHADGSCHGIGVIWLMHVPEETDASSFHGTWGYAAPSGKSRGESHRTAFTGIPGEACTIKSCAVLITSLEFLSCFAMALSQTDGTSKAGMKEDSEY